MGEQTRGLYDKINVLRSENESLRRQLEQLRGALREIEALADNEEDPGFEAGPDYWGGLAVAGGCARAALSQEEPGSRASGAELEKGEAE